jgi:hypothetical protein
VVVVVPAQGMTLNKIYKIYTPCTAMIECVVWTCHAMDQSMDQSIK